MIKWFLSEKVDEDKTPLDDNEDKNTSEEDEDFLSCKLYEDYNVKYYSTDARDFIPNIKLWSTQRSVNQEHVQDLIKNLKTHNSPHFIGTFKIIRDKEGNKRLIDGQHRYYAIKKIMSENSKFNMNLIVELYETDHLDSERSINLFQEANSCLNVSKNDMPNILANNIIKNLSIRFKGMIIDVKDGKRCNRPRINKRELYLKLKTYIQETLKNEDEILQQIVSINNDYGCHGRQTFKKTTTEMFEKCKNSGWYLGLDLNFEWLNKIEW